MASFPNISNVDVWQYDNTFDYSRWMADSVFKLCSVPWRSDYSDVVKFDSDQERDAYFKNISGKADNLNTFFHILPETSVKVPVPVEVCQKYNYLVLTLPTATSDGNPIAYEGLRKGKFFFFVEKAIQKAPNTTELVLKLDMWTTYVNDVSINYMMLERGHAPLAATEASEYLSNPIAKNQYLLAPDVSFGEPSNVAKQDAVIFNDGNMYAVFVTTSNVAGGSWGTKAGNTWKTPGSAVNTVQGLPAAEVFAVAASDLGVFLSRVDITAPQFKQTVKAVFFANESLISLGAEFTFCNTDCVKVSATQQETTLTRLTIEDFGYPAPYRRIAKLYTSPYAHLELFNCANGSKTVVKVEDTSGTLKLETSLSIVAPYLTVNAFLTGVGSSETDTVSFYNVNRRSFKSGGMWYDNLMSWNVPTFAIYQDAGTGNDYKTHYSRKLTSDTNDENIAARTRDYNADKTLRDELKANTVTQIDDVYTATYGGDIGSTPSGYMWAMQRKANEKLDNDYSFDRAYQLTCLIENIDYAAMSSVVNSAAAATTSFVNMATSSSSMGDVAIQGVNTAVSVGASQYCTQMAISKSQTITDAANTLALQKKGQAKATANAQAGITQLYQETVKGLNKTKLAADLADVNTNALTKFNSGKTLANNTTTLSINAQKAGAAIGAPLEFGTVANGETAATMPQAVFTSVVTQPKAAIAAAGDQMLRYGYNLSQAWHFQSFNLMNYFTYWKCSDLWILAPNGCIEGAQEAIKSILTQGVTVWRNPDKIGSVSIYDN